MRDRSFRHIAVCAGLIAALIGITCLSGCVAGIFSSKPSSGSGQGKGYQGSKDPASRSDKTGGLKKPRIPPPPGSEPAPPPETGEPNSIDPRKKEEINASALEFAANIDGVLHVKTCYSKIFNQWYLLLYLKKGEKVNMEQYVWNNNTTEWEIYYKIDDLSEDKLKYLLKSEFLDEKCFILK